MKCLNEATDILEAHMIKGLLQQLRIIAFIECEYLNGAVDELPPSRLVHILVNYDAWRAGQEVADGGLPKRDICLLWAALAMVSLEVVRYWASVFKSG